MEIGHVVVNIDIVYKLKQNKQLNILKPLKIYEWNNNNTIVTRIKEFILIYMLVNTLIMVIKVHGTIKNLLKI